MSETKENQKHQRFESVGSLLQKKFPPIEECVPGFLSSGLAILAGKPKSGKSRLALQLALSVASGQPFLGHFPTTQGWAHYFALEDGELGLQERLNALGADESMPLCYSTSLEPGVPLEDLIIRSTQIAEGVIAPFRLFIVDTVDVALLWNVVDYDRHESLYGWLVDMNRLAEEMNMTILFVHHMQTNWMSDPLDRIFGPEGVYGACETSLLLERVRLCVFSRHAEEQRVVLEREGVRWKYVDKC